MSVKDNILQIRSQIASICEKKGRNPEEIKLVAVIKTAEIEQIKEAINAGVSILGGNKVQDSLKKYNELSKNNFGKVRISWHMIGHLQTNKVKQAVKIFDLIHSVDSLRLAKVIDREAEKINKLQDILVQVNVSKENTKFGLRPEEVIKEIKEIAQLKYINIKGLMTIAPLVEDAEEVRPYFRLLRELRDKINTLGICDYKLDDLSMGMTQDYKIAIEEGATIVRIGRAIFG
jgi:hypothetical protein